MNLLKQLLFRNRLLWNLYKKTTSFRGKVRITNHGAIRIRKEIEGSGHELIVGSDTVLNDTVIHMRGRNNKIIFGANCRVGAGCSFWVEGENAVITIGDGVTFTRECQVNAQEKDMSVTIGNDCMFSNHIIIRTSDSHPIYNADGKRINLAKHVVLGNHIWIAPDSTVMKGMTIGDGAIIGSGTIVTKDVPANTLVVGHPAHVVKEGIRWTREDVIFSNPNS